MRPYVRSMWNRFSSEISIRQNSKIIFGWDAFRDEDAVSISTIFRADGDRNLMFLSGLTLIFQYRFNLMKY